MKHSSTTAPFSSIRPSTLQFLVTVVVIGASMVLFSVGLAALIARLWDPCAVISAFIFLGLGSLTAYVQYVATFRRREAAAFGAAAVCMSLGGLMVMAILVNNAEFVLNYGLDFQLFPFGLDMFGLGAACLGSGIANARWGWRLKRLRTSPNVPEEVSANSPAAISARPQFTLCVVIASTTAFVRSSHPQSDEHVDADRVPHSLPRGASDVNYWDGSRGTFFCDFACSEATFREWINAGVGSIESRAARVQIEPIVGPVSIYCCQPPGSTPSIAEITVTDGLVYEWHKEDRGVHAVYDRSAGRGYFHVHSH
jgi:hypothetical protein